MNQSTKLIQKIKAKRLRETTFAIAKLEERQLNGEQQRKVQYCYRNIGAYPISHFKRCYKEIFFFTFLIQPIIKKSNIKCGSFGIAPTRNFTHLLKIGFYSYYIYQGNKSVKERKIVSFMHTKRLNTSLNLVGAIPRLP